MAKLIDLIPEVSDENQEFIELPSKNGPVRLPIRFTMQTMDYISHAYGAPFVKILKDIEKMDTKGENAIDSRMIRLMKALIYGVVRSGGTETTPNELADAIPISLMEEIFEKAMALFEKNYFQEEDTRKIKENDKAKK